ncbi:ectoine/hydroxyectoine ABC transporter substrate-binding protein EhuB [Bacillus sp. FSL W7-1360]
MKKVRIFGFLLLSISMLAACGDEKTGGDAKLIRVGVANEAPYGYMDMEKDEVTGANPEIARAVFQSMGYEDIQGEVADFGSLIQGVNAGNFDVVTAGMDIRKERCENGNFADIEIQYGEGMAVAAGNPLNLRSYEDIAKNRDVKVAVMAGANQIDMLKSLGVDDSQLVIADDIPANIAALESGKADAMVATDATVNAAVQNAHTDKIIFVDDFTQPIIEGVPQVAYGAAVFPLTEEGEQLRDEYNEALAKLIESGELLEIIEAFGFTEANLPPTDITTEQRCNM